jgi:hypothetical protein
MLLHLHHIRAMHAGYERPPPYRLGKTAFDGHGTLCHLFGLWLSPSLHPHLAVPVTTEEAQE